MGETVDQVRGADMRETYSVLDHGYVKFVEAWGSDEGIVESARMSTGKGFKGWGPVSCPCWGRVTQRLNAPEELRLYYTECKDCHGTGKIPGDEKFLRFLYENKHMSPFEQAGMTIEVQAPIFVFREWHRHRTQSYNEMSARYTVMPDLYYVPSLERLLNAKQSSKNKQGSVRGFDPSFAEHWRGIIEGVYKHTRELYDNMIANGVAREVARVVLPVGQYSRMRASANLRNWMGFLALRLPETAQWEIRQYANAVRDLLEERFPRTVALFSEEVG